MTIDTYKTCSVAFFIICFEGLGKAKIKRLIFDKARLFITAILPIGVRLLLDQVTSKRFISSSFLR